MDDKYPGQHKDDGLAQLARTANVAQFVSFGPGGDPQLRHQVLSGHDFEPDSLDEAIQTTLDRAAEGTVNVRSFQPDNPKSRDFFYGLDNAADASALVRKLAADGLHTIVNETIDIHDGGVSGVAVAGVMEFAPDDTPRCVERPGTFALPTESAQTLLSMVYGVGPDLPFSTSQRVEWSVHPRPVGQRGTHTLVWEIEEVEAVETKPSLVWPNRFSRIIGDKAFGLMVADLLGLPVPHTTVIGRRIAPFSFGQLTGSPQRWLRTCPLEQVPGKYTTSRMWSDPYALLAHEDPDGTAIASVISQHGVPSAWSGALMPAQPQPLVEGVPGMGDAFMQGAASPVALPEHVVAAARALSSQAAATMGPARLEWVHDGRQAWVVQLHMGREQGDPQVVYPGEARRWQTFDPTAGLDALRLLIDQARHDGDTGIEISAPIGVTSHVGDLLRKAKVPSRIVAN